LAAAGGKPLPGHQVLQAAQPANNQLKKLVRLGFILLLALTATGLARPGHGQETAAEPWTLEADRVTYQNDPQQLTAEGEVVLRHNVEGSATPFVLRADTISYQAAGTALDARGDVSLREERGAVSAADIHLNLQARTGRLTESTISPADQVLKFSGRRAEKIDEARYVFYDGRATSCASEGDKPPTWSINWRKADITIDGMAYLQHATFKIKRAPLLYIPYLAIPAKITRQTGFLFPELSHSNRDGFGWLTPFFVNLSPSSDLTVYPGHYEKRGVFAGLEFRQVTDYDSRATLAVNYLQDRTEDQGPAGSEDDYRRDGYLRNAGDRYWVRGKADQHLSRNTVLRLDVDVVSDQDFLQEYREGITGFTRSNRHFLDDFNRGLQEASLNYRESILQLASRGQLGSGGLEARYVDNPQDDLPAGAPIQTLPRAVFSSRLPFADLPVSFDWDSEYVYYHPEDGGGYQRLDLLPKVILPMPFGSRAEGAVAAGFRETFYLLETVDSTAGGWDSPGAKNRNTLDFASNIATTLARDFNIGDSRRLTHSFRPNLRYNYQASGDQSDLPNLDGIDRLADDNSLTLELNNYFRSGGVGPASPPPRQLGYVKLKQSYNLKEARRNLTAAGDQRRPFSDLALDLEIAPRPKLYLRYRTALSLYGQGISRYHLQSRYSNSRRDNLTLDYDYVKGGARSLSIASQLRLTAHFRASFSTTRSLLDNHATSEVIGLLYTAQCWGVELTSSRDSEDRRLMLTFSLTGIGKALEMDKSGV
jgi:LPS-assembly protein